MRHLVEPGKDGVVRYSNGRTGAADHAARASSDVRMRELRRCGLEGMVGAAQDGPERAPIGAIPNSEDASGLLAAVAA